MKQGESRVHDFLYYCRHFTRGQKRREPLRDATIDRYYRGLQLTEKILGHSIETIDERDQLKFLDAIRGYKQGTRKVTIEIFQRYIAYLIRKGHYDGPNLLFGREREIIGEFEPLQVNIKSVYQIRRFLNRIQTPVLRVIFGLMYYGGLTAEEIASIKTEAITEKGVFVRRRVRRQMQLLPLPMKLLDEIREYAETRDESLFDFSDNDKGRQQIAHLFQSAKIEANYLHDMTLKDFRRSGIKHFYEQCYDLDLTKRFAGVKDVHKGWLDSLQDEASFHMETIARRRTYHGKSKLQADR